MPGVDSKCGIYIPRLQNAKQIYQKECRNMTGQNNLLVYSAGRGCTGNLSSMKRLELYRNQQCGHDCRILSMVMKIPLTTLSQVKSALCMTDLKAFFKSTIIRSCYKSEDRFKTSIIKRLP